MATIFPRLRLLKAHVTAWDSLCPRDSGLPSPRRFLTPSFPYCSFARRRFRLVTSEGREDLHTPFLVSVFFFAVSLGGPFHRSPIASYIELPHRTPPFRANSKAIRMAIGTTYTKTKNFFVARTGMPIHFSVRAFIDRVSLCVDAFSCAVPISFSCFCILYTTCFSIVCPRVIIYARESCHTYTDYNYPTFYVREKSGRDATLLTFHLLSDK